MRIKSLKQKLMNIAIAHPRLVTFSIGIILAMVITLAFGGLVHDVDAAFRWRKTT